MSLHIRNSLSLDCLFVDFIEKIKNPEVWNDPFSSPLVVFSDIKVEQWFKLAWLNSKKEKDTVLMNLNSARLESLVFEMVAGGIAGEEKIWYERLTQELLRDELIQKLISNDDKSGKVYYKTLNSQSVIDYIEDESGKVNEIRLYNFCKILADLFMNYTASRNADFDSDGIYAKWLAGENYFCSDDKKTQELENWQKTLFAELFTGEKFTVNESDSEYTISYVTLEQLVDINKKSNENGKLVFKTKSDVLFIFGFSGMGQAYRNILKQLAESEGKEVYLYCQAADIDYKTAENPLLKKWNQTGYENFTLWKKDCNEVLQNDGHQNDVVQISGKTENETLLKTVQNQILNNFTDKNELSKKLESKDGSIVITAVPSTLREIEVVHSAICSIINEKKSAHEPINYSDFVILAPNVQDYRVPVKQVFDQSEKSSESEFPHIPYVFSDYSAEYSSTAEAMWIFVSMLEKKSLDRKDLFMLLRNNVVRRVRNFSDDEITAWSQWVSELNGYRDRKSKTNEWNKQTRRLMLSRLTDNVYDAGNNDFYVPYSNMESEDSDSLYKFVEAIDSLEQWISAYKDKTQLVAEDLEEIYSFLTSWLLLGKELPSEVAAQLSGERIVFSGIREEINNQRLLLQIGNKKRHNESINARDFFIALKDSASASKGSSTNLFTGGITFGNFALNRTIPAKYVFILGLDSQAFPGTEVLQSLDLRSTKERFLGDESIPARNKEAFLCQFMATGEKFSVSYVNKDLKKDADFFRSSVVDDLIEFIKRPEQKREELETRITIDENREWKEIFTQREFRNKKNFERLMDTATSDSEQSVDSKQSQNPPDIISISKIKSFLENPFIYYAKSVFDCDSEDEGEEEFTEFEPVKLEGLKKAEIVKKLVLKHFVNPESDILAEIEKNIHELELEGAIPDVVFGEYAKYDLQTVVNSMILQIEENVMTNGSNYCFNESRNLNLSYEHCGKIINWKLRGSLCSYSLNNSTLDIFDLVTSKNLTKKHFLSAYITALILIAEMETSSAVSGSTPVTVNLRLVLEKDIEEAAFVITKDEAIQILNNIFTDMFVTPYMKFVSINMPSKGRNNQILYTNWTKFINAVEKDRSWKYLSKKRLFMPNKDFGYNPRNISSEYDIEYNKMKSLIRFI